VKLKAIPKVPDNGIALFVGEAVGEYGKIRRLVEAIEPPKPIPSALYRCEDNFIAA